MELSQMLGCRENDNPCQLTRHTTPLSPRRGAGGEAKAYHSSLPLERGWGEAGYSWGEAFK